MKKGYKYRLNMNYDDAIFFKNLLFSQNQTYNIIHSIKEKEYQLNQDRKSKDLQPEYYSGSFIDSEFTRILKQRNLLYKNNIIQQTRREYESETSKRIQKLKNGIDIGVREYKKYSKNGYQSFKATTFTILEHPYSTCKHKILRIFGKSIPFRYSIELPSEPKTVTLSYDGLDFYISFTVEINETKITHKGSKKIGLDINNKSLDLGNKKIHKKIDIKSMKKNILDISYSEVLRVLEYKCVQFGIKYSKVEPRNTSKTCHKCGVINNELTLKDRIFECEACGYIGDRDHNACINIMSKVESAS